ncbi:hypothetical protein [Burkholderia pseudomallei]|uniref:hypothetical protein n=1 Tax=Burkholderia pseudomallei TaxID=28450 RepID=UPI00051546DB|nr:hypothetical protein [Burkholderia pseudomallei]AIS91233.1 transcriptional regulator, TetR family domain protein [Burkholderia pseudomallei NAU35A-3]
MLASPGAAVHRRSPWLRCRSYFARGLPGGGNAVLEAAGIPKKGVLPDSASREASGDVSFEAYFDGYFGDCLAHCDVRLAAPAGPERLMHGGRNGPNAQCVADPPGGVRR